MRTDLQIQKEVVTRVGAGDKSNAQEIKIRVINGIVTLTGFADSYSEKANAEKLVATVKGVRGIVNDIIIKMPEFYKKSDEQIEKVVLASIKWNSNADPNKIKISVKNGVVKLEGEVQWDYQKSRVKILVSDTIGVREVINLIAVVPNTDAMWEKGKFNAA